MKLATFEASNGRVALGIVTAQERVIDISLLLPQAPRDMISLIANWAEWQPALAALATGAGEWAVSEVRLHAPVPRPGKILGIGLNYADHVAEANMARPEVQLWFTKLPTSARGPFDSIDLPKVSEQLDYEAEMAFVIGRRCRHATREQAAEAIFGYCVANDVSVRDWQLRTSQFMLGKSFDTHAPFGPWITTSDEIANPHALDIRGLVNGEVRQSSNTHELIFDCFDQIVHLSQVCTLEPGDIILSGTPGGVGAGFKPPRWLKAGDVVRVEIQGLGHIENRVETEA